MSNSIIRASEQELRQIFSRFGEVQTCIVNPEKHHAFVKMANRTDSVAAKLGMEKEKNPQVLNRARQVSQLTCSLTCSY